MTSTYLGYRLYANDMTKALQRVAAEPTTAREQKYYLANIGKVTSVGDFVNNYRLFTYAMKAYGLQDMGNAKGFMTKVLESDLSDKTSFANKLSDARYRAFAKAFQFDAKGLVGSTAHAQTSTQQADTTSRFAAASTASAADQAKATSYFEAKSGKVGSVAALESDMQLYDYVMTAYGLDPATTSTDTVTKALESDLSDSTSFANTSGSAGLKALAADFNFSAAGKVASPRYLQSAAAITATTTAYTAASGTDTASKTAAADATTYYASQMPSITSVDAFLSDTRLVAYAEKAYGLSTTTSTAQLKAILTSDLADPKSAAKAGGAARAFAAAFDVTTSGTIAQVPAAQAQSKAAQAAITDAYLAQTMESEAGDQNEGVKLALYFRRLAPSITSPYQILADKALTKVVQTMLGLSSTSSKADVDSQARTITSKLKLADLQDPKKVDKLVARFAALYDMTDATDSTSTSLVV